MTEPELIVPYLANEHDQQYHSGLDINLENNERASATLVGLDLMSSSGPDLIPPGPIAEDPEVHRHKMAFYCMLFMCMIFFFFTASLVEVYKPMCGHQTSFTIIFGVCVSLLIYLCSGFEKVELYEFKQDFFFDFLLPPIILNSGFNMRRKKFFQNIGNIVIFGLFVTIVCFVIYSVSTWAILKNVDVQMTNYFLNNNEEYGLSGGPKRIELELMQILLFTSLLCSSDVVAAVSIVSYEAQPKLFSCIFGEGCFNDIVSIILFNTIRSLQG